jgi:hypothetical protein
MLTGEKHALTAAAARSTAAMLDSLAAPVVDLFVKGLRQLSGDNNDRMVREGGLFIFCPSLGSLGYLSRLRGPSLATRLQKGFQRPRAALEVWSPMDPLPLANVAATRPPGRLNSGLELGMPKGKPGSRWAVARKCAGRHPRKDALDGPGVMSTWPLTPCFSTARYAPATAARPGRQSPREPARRLL